MTSSASENDDLKYRSLRILAFYLALAVFLTSAVLRDIVLRADRNSGSSVWKPNRSKVFLFGLLAVNSLATTWYYMFSFFAYSYHNWACDHGLNDGAPVNVTLRNLELWLRETTLFKDAWGAVVATPHRYWWSGQVFLWTTAWSLFLGIMGRRYNIKSTWIYMLLGQIVAISFASNLFYIAVLLSRPQFDAASAAWTPALFFEIVPLLISLVSSVAVPYGFDTKYFFLVLLIPHLLLFIPGLLSPQNIPTSMSTVNQDRRVATRRYIGVFSWLIRASLLILAGFTYLAFHDRSPIPLRRASDTCATEVAQDDSTANVSLLRIFFAMFEHPAVNSVSWDVIFCTISCWAWAAVHQFNPSLMLGDSEQVADADQKKDE